MGIKKVVSSWVLRSACHKGHFFTVYIDEMAKYAGDLQNSMDAILPGRVTYQIMTNYWPTTSLKDDPGAERINNVPKIVFSKTLDKVEWGKYNNARVVVLYYQPERM